MLLLLVPLAAGRTYNLELDGGAVADDDSDATAWLNGAALNATDNSGRRPMHYACDKGHLETAQWLHAHGASLDAHERTRVVEVVSTEGGELGEHDKEIINSKGEPLHRCTHCDKHPWLNTTKRYWRPTCPLHWTGACLVC